MGLFDKLKAMIDKRDLDRKERMQFPFSDAPNTAALTCCHIIDEGANILYVSHDEDDGMWQFLCGRTHKESDARIVSLYSVFERDNSIAKLTDMPCGYIAERESVESDWIVKKVNL